MTLTLDGAVIGTTRLDAGGRATFEAPTLSTGLHGIRAHYGGDSLFEPSTSAVLIQRVEGVVAVGLRVDSSPGPASNGNGVLEAGETVTLAPTWRNGTTDAADAAGTLDAVAGPAGALYTLLDASADYGSIAPGALRDCAAMLDCYAVAVSGGAPARAAHRDATVRETLTTGETKAWTLHLGKSFRDVPVSNLFYRPIETLLHHQVVVGCAPDAYCPRAGMNRASMAVVLARADLGGRGPVPDHGTVGGVAFACAPGGVSVFQDVAPTDPFCPHVHHLAAKGVTGGCGPFLFCPGATMTREETAVFIAREMAGNEPVPIAYGPDPGTGRSYSCDPSAPRVRFTDIAPSDTVCRHVHYVWARGVADGFGDRSYRPETDVTREQMAKFVAKAFRFELYGP